MCADELDHSREHDDPLAEGSRPLVVDRQRIVHSAAFRRLQYKTQVFLALDSDHYRTRLTHTLEVAHLARCLAERLELNVDLAEVVALAHDLGHSPFGHAGEQALNECMAEHGGFEHNAHALRVVEYLEHPYPDFRGLNLTRVVRECLAKHTTQYDRPGAHALQDGRPPPPEGQVAALADQLAYGLHDVQDALYAGLIEPRDLSEIDLWTSAGGEALARDNAGWRGRLRPVIDRIQETVLAAAHVDATCETVDLTQAMQARVRPLEIFLRESVYRHERLAEMDERGRQVITAVFQAFVSDPSRMPPRFGGRVTEQGPHRVAADYVAGMTDRFCLAEHARLQGPAAA